jgi:hypothetical protein
MLEIELSLPLPAVAAVDPATGRRYGRAMIFVRLHEQPLGLLELALPAGGLAPEAVAAAAWRALAPAINGHLEANELPAVDGLAAAGIPAAGEPRCRRQRAGLVAAAPFATVVVCTRDRADALADCLRSLLALDYPDFEVVVVDNAPRTDATARLVREAFAEEPRLRYVREDRPGLSHARNRGVAEARAEFLAFTDDDAVVDRRWLAELITAFGAGERVMCVTGLTIARELETPAQGWFEEFGGFARGFARRVYGPDDAATEGPLYPYAAGRFGSGVNMALRRAFLAEVGGFDPALGVGTPTRGGEDLAAFAQVIARGHQLAYEPAAIVRHLHRGDYAGLAAQVYGTGVGLTAYLTKLVIDRPLLARDFAVRAGAALRYLLDPTSPKNRAKRATFPPELQRLERRGQLAGPVAYLRARWRAGAGAAIVGGH